MHRIARLVSVLLVGSLLLASQLAHADDQTARKEGTPERLDDQTLRKEGTPERPDDDMAAVESSEPEPALAYLPGWTEKLFPGSREAVGRLEELATLLHLLGQSNAARGIDWLAYGTGTVGGASASGADTAGIDTQLTVGGEVAIAGDGCQLAALGAQGVLGLSSGDTLAGGEQWVRLCLGNGIPIPVEGWDLRVFPLSLHNQLALHARPALGARRLILSDTYDSETFGFDVIGMYLYYGNGSRRAGFVGFSSENTWLWQDPGSGRQRSFSARGEMWVARLERFRRDADALGNRLIDIFVIGYNGVRGDDGVAIIEFLPVRLRGMSLGSSKLYWDLEAGGGGTGTLTAEYSVDGEPVVTEPIVSDSVPDVTVGIVRAAVYGGSKLRNHGIAFDRRLEPTPQSELVLDDRVSAWTRWAGPLGSLDLRAFVGRTIVWPDRDREDHFLIGGGVLDFDYAMSNELSFGIDAEVGQSFYVPGNASGASLEPRLGYRFLATLTVRRYGSRPL